MANLSSKNSLRQHYRHIRQRIARTPQLQIQEKGLILSYASFNSEFPTHSLNQKLLEENRLVLPKIEGENLQLYHVKSLAQLEKNRWGIFEPISCTPVSPADISLALIPALAFDTNNHRLGYGKGYFDRLLPHLPLAYGFGFKEQLHSTLLPTTPNDKILNGLLLF